MEVAFLGHEHQFQLNNILKTMQPSQEQGGMNLLLEAAQQQYVNVPDLPVAGAFKRSAVPDASVKDRMVTGSGVDVSKVQQLNNGGKQVQDSQKQAKVCNMEETREQRDVSANSAIAQQITQKDQMKVAADVQVVNKHIHEQQAISLQKKVPNHQLPNSQSVGNAELQQAQHTRENKEECASSNVVNHAQLIANLALSILNNNSNINATKQHNQHGIAQRPTNTKIKQQDTTHSESKASLLNLPEPSKFGTSRQPKPVEHKRKRSCDENVTHHAVKTAKRMHEYPQHNATIVQPFATWPGLSHSMNQVSELLPQQQLRQSSLQEQQSIIETNHRNAINQFAQTSLHELTQHTLNHLSQQSLERLSQSALHNQSLLESSFTRNFSPGLLGGTKTDLMGYGQQYGGFETPTPMDFATKDFIDIYNQLIHQGTHQMFNGLQSPNPALQRQLVQNIQQQDGLFHTNHQTALATVQNNCASSASLAQARTVSPTLQEYLASRESSVHSQCSSHGSPISTKHMPETSCGTSDPVQPDQHHFQLMAQQSHAVNDLSPNPSLGNLPPTLDEIKSAYSWSQSKHSKKNVGDEVWYFCRWNCNGVLECTEPGCNFRNRPYSHLKDRKNWAQNVAQAMRKLDNGNGQITEEQRNFWRKKRWICGGNCFEENKIRFLSHFDNCQVYFREIRKSNQDKEGSKVVIVGEHKHGRCPV